MAFLKVILCSSLLVSLGASAATKIDKKETINGVTVESGKEDSTRVYRGSITKSFPYPLTAVKSSVVNFEDKCNNKYKNRRQYGDKNRDCKYHNENLVETVTVRDINKEGWSKEANEVDRYVVGRQVYNRGSFGYYELVRVMEGKNEQNQKTLTIVLEMLDDSQAKTYIKPAFSKDSAFDKSLSLYVLTEISPKETTLTYAYEAETEHWVLNKEVSVPQVFASISKSINDLVKTVDAESSKVTRDLASN